MAAVWAAMLLTLTWAGDAGGLHPCPHHSPAAAPAAVEARADHGASHGAHAPPPGHDTQEHGACTCVGSCIACAVDLPPTAREVRVRVASEFSASAPLPTDTPALPERVPYLLPYATAPPTVA